MSISPLLHGAPLECGAGLKGNGESPLLLHFTAASSPFSAVLSPLTGLDLTFSSVLSQDSSVPLSAPLKPTINIRV